MTPTVSIDTREFHAAMREYLAVTKSTLEDATNRRLFFVLARAFVLMKPHAAQSERNRIRDYLNAPIGERRFDKATGKKVGSGRMLQRRHLIAQSKNRQAGNKGLYGDDMKKAAAKLSKQSIGSVGYLKSVIAKAIKLLRGGNFKQFGLSTKKAGGKQVSGNAALIAFASQYGTSQDNVAMHKGGRAYVLKARPGFSPYAVADMAVAIANGQDVRVNSNYAAAFQKAFDDERIELQRYLADRMQADADRFNGAPA